MELKWVQVATIRAQQELLKLIQCTDVVSRLNRKVGHWMFKALLSIFFILSPLLAFSTELTSKSDYRTRVLKSIQAENSCKVVVTRGGASRSAVTRGGTTRGASPLQASALPSKVQEFSDRYAKVIQAEFEIPYGFEHDPQSYFFFKNDPYEGAAKLNIYEQIGYRWSAPGAPSKSLTWMEQAQNYKQYLINSGRDPKKNWTPVMVLYRFIGKTIDPATKKEVDKYDYLFIDPLTESFPSDMTNWNVLTKDVQFNIPFNAIFSAFQKGQFPILDANHDFNHLVSGLRFPELTSSIIEMIQKVDPKKISLGFKRRQYWLTEALSILDPASQQGNHDFLKKQGRSTKLKSVESIEKEVLQMGESAMVAYALKLSRYFESQLRDVSGGNSNSAEKWYYLGESFGMKAKDLIFEDITSAERLDRLSELSRTYFDNGPVTLNANAKKMTNETATFNFNTFVTSQKILALLLSTTDSTLLATAGYSKELAVQDLARYVSRIEWLLIQKPFTYQEWATSFLKQEMALNHPMSEMLMTVFGNELVERIYLGFGEKRTEN